MKHLSILFFFICTLTLHAQKKMTKSFSTENIKTINFKLNQVSNITLKTHQKPEVYIEANVEGEHSEHIVLTSKRLFGSLLISSEFQPTFKSPNDKLSAHKVMSIELLITVPEDFSVYLKSDIANVLASGTYNKLTLELSSGNCKVSQFSGHALINTIQGNIGLKTNHASVEGLSQTGKVTIDNLISGENTIKLNTINGDITVTKSQ